MHDGGGGSMTVWNGGGITIEEAFPYGFPRNTKKMIVAPSGVCDPTMPDTRERLAPWRAGTAFFKGTVAGAGSNIVFATGQSPLVFTQGPDDSAEQAGSTGTGTNLLKRSDANSQQGSDGGGLARSGQAFIATGLWFQWEEPWTVATGVAMVGVTRTASAFLRSPVSPYNRIICQMLSSVINPQVKNGRQTACDFDALAVDLWAQGSGVGDAKIGFGGIGGSFYHLAVPQVSGGQGSGNELQLKLVLDRGVVIENDAANATPAGVDVVAAIRAVVVGYPICVGNGTELDYDRLADAIVRKQGKVNVNVQTQQNNELDLDRLAELIAKKQAMGLRGR